MNRGDVTSLILLDLSAAFDTVDHSLFFTRLQNWFGLDGLSLDWFTSYLSSRSQAVSINDSISVFSTLSCGVPQGPVKYNALSTAWHPPAFTFTTYKYQHQPESVQISHAICDSVGPTQLNSTTQLNIVNILFDYNIPNTHALCFCTQLSLFTFSYIGTRPTTGLDALSHGTDPTWKFHNTTCNNIYCMMKFHEFCFISQRRLK